MGKGYRTHERTTYKALVGKSEAKKPLRRPRCR
jgi:hypothetical protein